MTEPIHYVEIFDRILTYGTTLERREEYRVLCGATAGEADTRRRAVTCPACRELLPAVKKTKKADRETD